MLPFNFVAGRNKQNIGQPNASYWKNPKPLQLFHYGLSVLAGAHIGSVPEAFGKVLGRIVVQKLRDLG